MTIISNIETLVEYSPELKNLGIDGAIGKLVENLGEVSVKWKENGLIDDMEMDNAKRSLYRLKDLLIMERYPNYCPSCLCRFRAVRVDADNNKVQGLLSFNYCPLCGKHLNSN